MLIFLKATDKLLETDPYSSAFYFWKFDTFK